MKLVATKAWILWGALADGKRQHVRDLAQLIGCDAHALYGQWKQLPSEIQKQLRQHDGWWQLKQAMAVVSPVQAAAISDSTGFEVEVLPETTSTNDVLWQRWHEGQDIHKHMVCALEQSQGRGRLQRPWQNVPGQTLMFSLAYHIAHGSAALAALPLIVGLVVQQTLAEQQVHAQLKWPNDIVVGARKLCGILVESKQRGERWHVVIGIGVNVMPPQQEALRDLATACNAQTADFSCASFLAQLLPQLDQALQVFFKQGFEAFQAAYAAQMRDVNQPVQLFERGKLIGQGTAVGVTEVGSLRVVDEAGQEQVYLNGEISMRPETANDVPQAGNIAPSQPEPLPVQQSVQASHEAEPAPENHRNVPSNTTAAAPVEVSAAVLPPLSDLVKSKVQPHEVRYILLDGGNSQLKWAWVDGAQQLHFGGRAPYANLQAFADFMAGHAADLPIIGCAVCGAKKMALVEEAAARSVRWLPSMRHALGVTNHYYKVQQHGSDRWFNVLGSRLFSPNTCVVVSCGTAITIDAITHDNHYLGGSIMPGFNLMKEAMAAKTANLNQPIGKAYPFATSTPNALASGMHDAASGAVILMHQRLKERQQGLAVDLILTGGGASKIEKHLPQALILDSQVKIVDNLVLFGLQNWVEHTCNY